MTTAPNWWQFQRSVNFRRSLEWMGSWRACRIEYSWHAFATISAVSVGVTISAKEIEIGLLFLQVGIRWRPA